MGQGQGQDDGGTGAGDATATEVGPAPAGAASTAATSAAPAGPPSLTRRLLTTGLLVLVLAAGAAGALLLFGDFRKTRHLRHRAEAILVELSQGKAEEVYDKDASFRFKQTVLVDKFRDLVERMNGTLGKFRGITDVVKVERSSSVAGTTAQLDLKLEFERGTTTGEISLLRGRDGKWQLLGFSVVIPPALQARANQLERQDKRLRAPDEVIGLVHSILEGVKQGRATEVHDSASPAFQGSISAAGFQRMLDAHREELGDFVQVLAILSSAQNADKDRASVQALLQYERATTTGTFDFMRVSGQWRLLHFNVVIPPPLLPPEN